MRNFLIASISVIMLGTAYSSSTYALTEPTDHILDDTTNSFYMVQGNYLQLSELSDKKGSFNKISRISLVDGSVEVIYESPNASLSRLLLSPDNRRIAALKGCAGWFGEKCDLIVIDIKEKKEIASIRDEIGKYIWSPDSSRLLYIAGGIVEGRGFHSTAVWIYEIAKNEKTKIAEGARDVVWMVNNDIYVIDYRRDYLEKRRKSEMLYKSFIYSYKEMAAKVKNIKGVSVSLDGRYSILPDPNYEGYPTDDRTSQQMHADIYDLQSNINIPRDKLSNIFSEPSRISWGSLFWAAKNRIIFTKIITEKLYYDIVIGNIESNSVLKILRGVIVGTNNERSKLLIYFNGKFDIVNVQ